MSKTILLVEDDIDLAKMYSTKFIDGGFNVLAANDGETGLDLALKNNVDVILLDMMLPKMHGRDFLAKLRANPAKKALPVLVLSNLTIDKEARYAKDLGVKEYLAKAMFTPEQILQKINQYLKN